MAKSRYDVEINGDNKGLSKSIDKSMEQLNELDSVANGLFSNMTGPLNNLNSGISGIAGMSSGMQALGIAGMAAGVGVAALNTALEKQENLIRSLRQLDFQLNICNSFKKNFALQEWKLTDSGILTKILSTISVIHSEKAQVVLVMTLKNGVLVLSDTLNMLTTLKAVLKHLFRRIMT